jgi:hypothetical protein
MSSEIGTRLVTGITTVTTAGTRIQMPTLSGEGAAKTITLEALGTNEGVIVIGDSKVVAAAGSHATPTQRGISLAAKGIISIEICDTGAIWLDTTKSGDAVSWMALIS